MDMQIAVKNFKHGFFTELIKKMTIKHVVIEMAAGN
jgi:molybdopterin-binding protein